MKKTYDQPVIRFYSLLPLKLWKKTIYQWKDMEFNDQMLIFAWTALLIFLFSSFLLIYSLPLSVLFSFCLCSLLSFFLDSEGAPREK